MSELIEITHDLGAGLGQWELFQPNDSGRGPMRRGTCPGCEQQTEGYRGPSAAIRYRNAYGELEVRVGVTSSYGHFECVREIFMQLLTDEIATRHIPNTVPPTLTEPTVYFGTQREMIDFVKAHHGQGGVVTDHYPTAPRTRRYSWYLRGEVK